MAEQNLFCLCGRCSRKLRSAAARRVGKHLLKHWLCNTEKRFSIIIR